MKKALLLIILFCYTLSLFAKIEIEGIKYELYSNMTAKVVGRLDNVVYVNIPDELRCNGAKFKVTEIGERALSDEYDIYNSTPLKQLRLPKYLKKIGKEAFWGCRQLATIEFACTELTTIENAAFSSCTKLQTLKLPRSVQKIGEFAFRGCDIRNAQTFYDNIRIESNAFNGNHNLKIITLYYPIQIGGGAFGCDNLDTIYSYTENPIDLIDKNYPNYIPCSPKAQKNCIVVVPEDCIPIYKKLNGWNKFENYMDLLDTGVHSVKAKDQSLKVSSPSSCALRVSGLKPNETVRCYTTTGNLLCEYKAKSNEANLTLPVFSGNIVIVKAGPRSAKVRMK